LRLAFIAEAPSERNERAFVQALGNRCLGLIEGREGYNDRQHFDQVIPDDCNDPRVPSGREVLDRQAKVLPQLNALFWLLNSTL
jgi:hypothetical protein